MRRGDKMIKFINFIQLFKDFKDSVINTMRGSFSNFVHVRQASFLGFFLFSLPSVNHLVLSWSGAQVLSLFFRFFLFNVCFDFPCFLIFFESCIILWYRIIGVHVSRNFLTGLEGFVLCVMEFFCLFSNLCCNHIVSWSWCFV